MENLVTINNPNLANRGKFEDKRLEQATNQIIEIYSQAAVYVETKNRKIAEILAKVKTEKSYEADGFKSVADYAEIVFGIKRQNAYMLASAGEIYNDKSASSELKAFSPSKLAEISGVDREKLEADVKSGRVKSEDTQKDLREYATAEKSVAKKDKPEIVHEYTIRPLYLPALQHKLPEDEHLTIDEWDNKIVETIKKNFASIREPEIVKLPKCASYKNPSAEKKTTQRRLYITEAVAIVVEFYTYKTEKASKPATDKRSINSYTVEELRAMLAKKIAEQEEQ